MLLDQQVAAGLVKKGTPATSKTAGSDILRFLLGRSWVCNVLGRCSYSRDLTQQVVRSSASALPSGAAWTDRSRSTTELATSACMQQANFARQLCSTQQWSFTHAKGGASFLPSGKTMSEQHVDCVVCLCNDIVVPTRPFTTVRVTVV